MDKEKTQQKQGLARQPIVVVMGHVDHGKTTLLDYIRKARVAVREVGGITQSIGAYQAETRAGRKITFIDTPGHAAFTGMRARGAKAADVAVLVVAGDDGVMPQTKESLTFIRERELPLIVAITKIDKETAQVEKVKSQLAEEGVLLEGWGGNVPVCLVSGLTGEGVDDLLETIVLLAEVEGVKGDEKGELEAVVIEARRTVGRGPVATVIVRNGSLVVGEEVWGGEARGKVRGLFDERGKGLKMAGPGMPVEVLGWEEVPEVGSVVRANLKPKARGVELKKSEKMVEREGLKVVIKADSAGSLEALSANLPEGVAVVASGIGEIVEADVDLAMLAVEEGKARPLVIGFNVKAGGKVARLAEEKGVKVLSFNLIYELLDELARRVLRYREPTIDEEVLGEAEIVAEFPYSGKRVAGCRIVSGRVAKGDRLHLKRDGKVVGDCRIVSMRHVREEVDKVEKGGEVGILVTPQLDFKTGDVLVSYR